MEFGGAFLDEIGFEAVDGQQLPKQLIGHPLRRALLQPPTRTRATVHARRGGVPEVVGAGGGGNLLLLLLVVVVLKH